jgi:hypothetical protein
VVCLLSSRVNYQDRYIFGARKNLNRQILCALSESVLQIGMLGLLLHLLSRKRAPRYRLIALSLFSPSDQSLSLSKLANIGPLTGVTERLVSVKAK